MVLLVTGGIGSGKSVVCRMLEDMGIPVYDSDSRAKSLYERDRVLMDSVKNLFGDDIIGTDGLLDRKKLASRAFASAEATVSLNALVHPAVLRDFDVWSKEQSAEVVVMESALAGTIPEYRAVIDKILLVDAPFDLRLERAMKRDSCDRETVAARMSRQSFEGLAPDAVIVNDGSEADLRSNLASAMEKLSIFVHNNNVNKMKTNLSRILSVSGYRGLYLYLAQARNGAIAESLSDKKRILFDLKARISTLADIAIFTEEGELRLEEVFEKMHEVLGDADAPSSKAPADEIKAVFEKAVPTYDADRFYVSHMKKVVDWYNELKNYASLDFLKEGDVEEDAAEETAADQE